MNVAQQLDEDGYAIVRQALRQDEVAELRCEFDGLWHEHAGSVDQTKLLRSSPFIRLVEHPKLLTALRSVFGDQLQLLMYALRRHDGDDNLPERDWHRDFSFVCDRAVAVNALVYLDPTAETGPTVAVPGSHRWRCLPGGRFKTRDDEVPLPVDAGDIVLNDSTLWHSRGQNRSLQPRRVVILYFGYWWLKRYEADQVLPGQALENASPQRLQLLGLRMPGRDLHLYELAAEDG